jgi:Zn finger protein HypA/HybF involved in hydrogenase expression
MSEGTYSRIKAKCLNCSLHFVLCSWHPERHSAKSLYCPECGQHEDEFMVWIEDVAGAIVQEVPGAAVPHAPEHITWP